MSLTKLTNVAFLVAATVSFSLLSAYAQTGNTGGSSGGTGGGQHGEGSGPAGSVPATGGATFVGDPDKNPYASPTPTNITAGSAQPSATPKHHRNKSSGHRSAEKSSPSPSPSR